MNETEAERIATAVNALRPDWPRNSLMTLMQRPELAHKPRRDVAVAFAWVAAESESKTPARVLEAGPWWKAATTEGVVTRFPPRRGQDCRKHPGEWPESCRGCAGDRLAATETEPLRERTQAGENVERLRLVYREATAQLCSHGVAPRLCVDHRPEPTEECK